MIRRRHVQHLLSAYIDGDLSLASARAVAMHLEECPDCAGELEQWRAVLRLVSQHAAVSCPIDCAEVVLQRLQSPSSSFPRLRNASSLPGPFIRALALIVALVVGGTWLWTTRDSGRFGIGRAERVALTSGGAGTLVSLAPAAVRENPEWDSPSRGAIRLPVADARSAPAVVVPVHAPVRLEEAFGRSDSLILAADFAEDDR